MIKKIIVGFVIGLTVAVAVLSVVLIAVYAVEDVKHNVPRDFQDRVCEEKCVYAVVEAESNVEGVKDPNFILYYDDDDTLTVYLVGYRDEEFIKETLCSFPVR